MYLPSASTSAIGDNDFGAWSPRSVAGGSGGAPVASRYSGRRTNVVSVIPVAAANSPPSPSSSQRASPL